MKLIGFTKAHVEAAVAAMNDNFPAAGYPSLVSWVGGATHKFRYDEITSKYTTLSGVLVLHGSERDLVIRPMSSDAGTYPVAREFILRLFLQNPEGSIAFRGPRHASGCFGEFLADPKRFVDQVYFE